METLPPEYYHDMITHIELPENTMVYKFNELHGRFQEGITYLCTNHPFTREEYDRIMSDMEKQVPEDLELPVYAILFLNEEELQVSFIGICTNCAQHYLFDNGIHPENATDEEIAKMIVTLYNELVDGVSPHSHEHDGT